MVVYRRNHEVRGKIKAVVSGSFAERAGLRRGDELVSINGHALRDVIDVRYYASDRLLRLLVRRDHEERLVEEARRYDEPLGLEFDEPVFDQIRRCNNRCDFCFVAQMPPGLRPSLYVKDDDYRYSFLFGSYVTLSNLTRADWKRIGEQHLSPLYVSVHTTEPDLRRRFLRNPDAPDAMAQLMRLADLDIEVHTQIVVKPGVNDGSHIDRSISDLVSLYPRVRSVSVVPVGLTKYHGSDCRLHTNGEVRKVLERVAAWQGQFRDELGVTFVYLSDEWYLRLDRDVPPLENYDGLDLSENGVGLTRRFLAGEARRLKSLVAELESPLLVTGTLFAPLLRTAVAGLPAKVVPVVNRFFGTSVTVAGLLTAEDVVAQLANRDSRGTLILPPAMFAGPQGQSLDEKWPIDVEEAIGRSVTLGLTAGARPPRPKRTLVNPEAQTERKSDGSSRGADKRD